MKKNEKEYYYTYFGWGARNIVTVFSQKTLYASYPAKNFAITLKKYQHLVKRFALLQSC